MSDGRTLPSTAQGWRVCLRRPEALRGKPTEPGEMLGKGEMKNIILKPMVPFSSASSLSLRDRDSNDGVSDGLRGHLGKGAWCIKNIFVIDVVYCVLKTFCYLFLVFYPCFRMLHIHMVQNAKYKKAHTVVSLFPTSEKHTSIVVKSVTLQPRVKF